MKIKMLLMEIFKYCTNQLTQKEIEGKYITLGPLGPLLQRGVLVVLQSLQTLIGILLVLLEELNSLILSHCWWSSTFCSIFAVVQSEFIIFLISLIFEDIHFSVLLLPSSPSSFLKTDNLWLLLLSSAMGCRSEEDENTWLSPHPPWEMYLSS